MIKPFTYITCALFLISSPINTAMAFVGQGYVTIDSIVPEDFFNYWPKHFERQILARKVLPTNILVSNTHYILKIQVPGVTRKNIKVRYKNKTITIEAIRSHKKDKKTVYQLREIVGSSATRSYFLQHAKDGAKSKVTLKNGMLTITVPKSLVESPVDLLIE